MMPSQAQTAHELFADLQSKTFDAFSVVADMNHRVLQELVGLSASTAKESIRACAELQSAVVDAARSMEIPQAQPEMLDELRRNPFAWYQKSLHSFVEGTQKSFRLVEANAQVVTRTAERLQAVAERSAKEIQDALTSSVTRVKEVYGRA